MSAEPGTHTTGDTTVDVDAYLDRIGLGERPPLDVEGLTILQQAHLSTVAFENLDVFHKRPVRTDLAWSLHKIVDERRGGWCFENNGAFSALLDALGFPVVRLGAAVLLGGPNAVIDHLTLEVTLDQPYLVDVGFGDSFTVPLRLNHAGPQDGGAGVFQLLPSTQGTTLAAMEDDTPLALYRFKRVNRLLSDFDEASTRLQTDPELHWSRKPFATRLIDGGPDRVMLLSDRLKLIRGGTVTETPVAPENWDETLHEWFAMNAPD